MTNRAATESPPDEGEHQPSQCDECLEVDDHPKLHYGLDLVDAGTMRVIRKAPVYHHDCAPPSVRRDVLGDGSAHSISAAVTRAAFDGADRGLRGAELRHHIRAAGKAAEAKARKAAAEAQAAQASASANDPEEG